MSYISFCSSTHFTIRILVNIPQYHFPAIHTISSIRSPKKQLHPHFNSPHPHHTSLLPLKPKLPLNRIHHGLTRLPKRHGLHLPTHHRHQRRRNRPRARKQRPRRRERDIRIRSQKHCPALQVRERVGEFQITEMEVQTGEDDADGGVEGGAGGDGGVVFWFDGTVVEGVGAADVGDGFGAQFGFDAGFAEDEDGFLGGGEGEDAGDVDGGAVGGGEDFVLGGVVS